MSFFKSQEEKAKEEAIKNIQLNEQQQREVYDQTRDNIMSGAKKAMGLAALGFVGGHGVNKFLANRGKKFLKNEMGYIKQHKKLQNTLPIYNGDNWDEYYAAQKAIEPEMDKLLEARKKNMLQLGTNKILLNASSATKSGAKGALIGTGALMGTQAVSQRLDPDHQGILSDKLLHGDYNKQIMLGAAGLTGAGWGAKYHMQRKATSALMKEQPEVLLMKRLNKDKDIRKAYDDFYRTGDNEAFKKAKSDIDRKYGDFDSPDKVLSEEALRIKEIQREMKELPAGSVNKQMALEDEVAKLTKKMNEKAKIDKDSLKLQARLQGVQHAGGQGLAAISYLKSPLSPIKTEEQKRKEEIYNQQHGLTKLSFEPISTALTAGLGHLGQNAIFNYFTKTKSGRDKAAKFAIDKFTEGYTGKQAKSGISNKITRLLSKYDPRNRGLSKKEIVRKAREKGNKLSSYISGVGYNIMPEAETLAKELRHKGEFLRREGIDIKDLSKDDWMALHRISQGDLHGGLTDLSTSPQALKIAKVMFPSVSNQTLNMAGSALKRGSIEAGNNIKGIKAKEIEEMNKEWKDTNIQPLLESIGDRLYKDKRLSSVSSHSSILDSAKDEKKAYNISHAASAVAEPGLALLNGIKRAATMDKQVYHPMDSGVVRKMKDVANKTRAVLDATMVKAPNAIATAKGLAGIPFKETNSTMASQWLFSPALKANAEDAQRIANLTRPIINSSASSKVESQALDKAREAVNKAAEKAKEKAESYGTGPMFYINAAKDGLKELNKIDKDGDGKKAMLAGLRSMSHIKGVKKKGEKELKELGKKYEEKALDTAEKESDKLDNLLNKGVEEANELENRYKRWVAPTAAVGTTALSYPMLRDIYRRRQEEKKNNQKSLGSDTRQPVAA